MAVKRATLSGYIAFCESLIGIKGRPNKITRWYSAKINNSAFLAVAWCAESTTYALAHCGLLDTFGGQPYAYVPYVERRSNWHRGTSGIRRGDIPTFDWQKDGLADHIGLVVTKVSGNSVYTIEGNTGSAKGGQVMRRVRRKDQIRGYLRPKYAGAAPATTKDGDLVADGRFGTATVKKLQTWLNKKHGAKLTVDGKAGTSTWKALQKALSAPYVDGEISRQSYKASELGNGITQGWGYTGRGSKGSQTVVLLQKLVGATADGVWGEGTTKALQVYLNKNA